MKIKALVLWALTASLLLHGCSHREEAAVVEARKRMHEFQASLMVWNPTVSRRDGISGTIGGWFASVSNASLRTELALELADILVSVDLTNQPYRVVSPKALYPRPREEALTCYYRDYVRAAIAIMRDNGCSTESTMEFFFKALQKYKAACFSVPLAHHQLKGESREERQARVCCAIAGQSSYAMTMTEVSKLVLPYLSNYLPEELHDEFRQRIKPFFDFPSMEEFYEMMHPGYKYAPSLPSKPDAQKQESDNHDVEVEVDI